MMRETTTNPKISSNLQTRNELIKKKEDQGVNRDIPGKRFH